MFKRGNPTKYFCDDCEIPLAGWREGSQTAEIKVGDKTAFIRFSHIAPAPKDDFIMTGSAVLCDACMLRNVAKLKEAI